MRVGIVGLLSGVVRICGHEGTAAGIHGAGATVGAGVPGGRYLLYINRAKLLIRTCPRTWSTVACFYHFLHYNH